MAAVAYVDPGRRQPHRRRPDRVPVGVSAGGRQMAVLIQYLSAKVGWSPDRLPELLGDRLPGAGGWPTGSRPSWWPAATDLAEVIGGAIARHILFGIPLLAGA
ncbi:divalent metal cation transporter [Kocuria rhizophila]|nr:divalent metal cation transporter [Kocuria rhizophila]